MRRPATTPEGPARVAVYTRVSKEEQVKEHYSLGTQRAACLTKLDQVFGAGLYVPTFFTDDGIPGRYGLYDPHNPRRKHRPGLTAMREAFRRGEQDVICIYRSTRLWRKAAMGDLLMDEFVPYGLQRIISCWENMDFDTASGRFQLNVQAATGAFEAEQLGEWSSDALQKRLRDGYSIGRLYGWRPEKDDERTPGQRRGIVPIPEQAELVRELAQRYVAGDSVRALAKWLNTAGHATSRGAAQWSTGTLSRLIRNPVHAGLVMAHEPDGKPYLTQGQHYERRLYDPSLFHEIMARFGRDKAQNGRTTRTHDYLLGGIMRCGHCGRPLNGRRVDRLVARVYRCSSGSQNSDPDCTRNQERAEVVEALVIAQLRRLAQGDDVLQPARAAVEATLEQEWATAQAELAALEKRLQKLWGQYHFWSSELADGRCERDEYDVHLAEFRLGKAETSARIAQLQALEAEQDTRRTVLLRAQELVADFDASWEALSTEHRRELMQRVVESASMGRAADGQTEVTFKIRGFPPVTQFIGRLKRRDRPQSGPESLTPREQVVLYYYSRGMDREAIARRLAVTRVQVNGHLWQARRRLDAETPEAAWELAREFIEGNLHWLPLTGRRRKVKAPVDKPLLTDAQVKLLAHLRQGLEVSGAAEALAISAQTAYVQLKNCRDRLGVASTEDAIRKAVDLGLVE